MNHSTITAPAEERLDTSRMELLQLLLLTTGICLTAGSCVWGFFNRSQFAFSWLTAFLVCFTVCAGCFFWVILHHVVDADWTVVVRRVLETTASLFFPWLLLAFLPVLFNLDVLFAWWSTPKGMDPVLDHKSAFLNHDFFILRAVLYFLFFGGLSRLLLKLSIKQDETGDAGLSIRMRKASYFGMFFFVIFITLVAVDWLMGLNAHWYSTIFGVHIFCGSVVGSMALLILLVNGLRSAGYLKSLAAVEHNHVMGKLLFGMNIFWAYVAFCQYMLYTYANIPEETTFYITRNAGGWHEVSLLLVYGHFLLPFLLLLPQAAKRCAVWLSLVAAWVLLMHAVEIYWIVMPQMRLFSVTGEGGGLPPSFRPHLLDLTCLLGLASLLLWAWLRRLAGAALFPLRDPRLYESMTLTN